MAIKEVMMKGYVLFLLVNVVIICASCNVDSIKTIDTKEEKAVEIWEVIQQNMAPGAEASSERPFPDVLSEQEVLLKAVDYACKIGALDPSYYVYQRNPALVTAKIETPVLLYHVPTGTTNAYVLTAVDTDGTGLMKVYVSSSDTDSMDSFEFLRGINPADLLKEYTTHLITKREAIRLMKSQFPDKQISTPIAITGLHLEDSRYSNNGEFWYFTVNDNSRSASGEPEEYIIDSVISGWKNISGGMSNRAAISSGDGGSPLLNWNRMAKLETPLHIFERIEAARSLGGATKFTANPVRDVRYTPIPLK